jgi:predicted kinase
MVICLFGENCTGKSSIATTLKTRLGAELLSGKVYLRLAKNEAEARRVFTALLLDHLSSVKPLVYVASEPEQIALIPAGAFRVRVTAELARIRERFAARMGGTFDDTACDLHIHTESISAEAAAAQILSRLTH